MFKVLASILFLAILNTGVFAQDFSISVIATGGYYGENPDEISLSYTFGECAVKTFTLNTMAFTEGFQQGKINEVITEQTELKVFPNPVTKNKLLNVTLPVRENSNSYVIRIYSLTGQLMVAKQFLNLTVGVTAQFDFTLMSKGLYLVKIESSNGTIMKTYKVEKK